MLPIHPHESTPSSEFKKGAHAQSPHRLHLARIQSSQHALPSASLTTYMQQRMIAISVTHAPEQGGCVGERCRRPRIDLNPGESVRTYIHTLLFNDGLHLYLDSFLGDRPDNKTAIHTRGSDLSPIAWLSGIPRHIRDRVLVHGLPLSASDCCCCSSFERRDTARIGRLEAVKRLAVESAARRTTRFLCGRARFRVERLDKRPAGRKVALEEHRLTVVAGSYDGVFAHKHERHVGQRGGADGVACLGRLVRCRGIDDGDRRVVGCPQSHTHTHK